MRGGIVEVTASSVFDYRDEVVVELVGRDPEGEVSVVSYSFDAADGVLEPREPVDGDHAGTIDEALSEAGYTAAGLTD